MPNILFDLEVDRVDLVDEGANSAAHIKLYKRKEHDPMNLKEILAKMKPEHVDVINAEIAKSTTASEDVKAELIKAKEELAKAKEDLAKANEPAASDVSQEDVIKSLSPEVQAVFKSLNAQKEVAETIVKQLNDEKIEKDAIAKAKELKAIPVEESKLVEVVKTASPELFEVLKAASKAIGAEVLGEVGKSASNTDFSSTSKNDNWAKIEKMADALVTKDITKAKAITMVVKQNPELYNGYVKGGNE